MVTNVKFDIENTKDLIKIIETLRKFNKNYRVKIKKVGVSDGEKYCTKSAWNWHFNQEITRIWMYGIWKGLLFNRLFDTRFSRNNQ